MFLSSVAILPWNFDSFVYQNRCFTSSKERERCLSRYFHLFLTTFNHAALLLWPVGVAQISFQIFFCVFRVRWSISVIVSALSWLYSLNSLVLNKLFWWYCCRFLLYCRIGLVQALDILTLSCTDSLWHQVGTSSSWIIFPSYSICGTLFYFLWYTYILFQFLDTLFQSSFPPWIFIAFVFPIFSVFCITPSLSIITMPVAFNKQLRSVKFFILIFSIDGKWFSGSSCFSSFLNLLNSRDSS